MKNDAWYDLKKAKQDMRKAKKQKKIKKVGEGEKKK